MTREAALPPPAHAGDEPARANGLLAAAAAYTLWGLLPLYFKLIDNVSPFEIVAQRILWSLVLILCVIALRTGLGAFGEVLRSPRLMLALSGSAAMIACNWLIYVWAVHNDHVVAASLGYFLNPLVNILLGILFLGERLRRWQTVAVGIAAAGVANLAAAALGTLWVSLGLAVSFGFYGLIRKLTPVAPMRGLGAETLVLAPFALAYILWLGQRGDLVFGTDGTTTLLLVAAGVVTTLPLVLFAMAAQRLPMITLGILQYVAPTLQFLSGVFLLGETLSHGQLVSFALIWAGLALFTADSIRAARARVATG